MTIYTSDKKTPRPFITTVNNQRIPLGLAARRTIGKYHTNGTWHYDSHTIGGRIFKSHYLTGETWVGTNARIFRVRRGNGFFGSGLHERIQDQYPYFVPSSINNIQGAAARSALATAVYNWQNVLTEAQKIEYNKEAARRKGITGYNIYIGEYVKANA